MRATSTCERCALPVGQTRYGKWSHTEGLRAGEDGFSRGAHAEADHVVLLPEGIDDDWNNRPGVRS